MTVLLRSHDYYSLDILIMEVTSLVLKKWPTTVTTVLITSFKHDFNLEEEDLPNQQEFNEQIRQGVLTSTDPSESLESHLNKINTPALSFSVTL